MDMKKKFSPAGNRTPVSRVTGGDTHHYTTEDTRQPVFIRVNCRHDILYSIKTHYWLGLRLIIALQPTKISRVNFDSPYA